MIKIIGSEIYRQKEDILSHYGPETYNKILGEMDASVQEVMNKPIMSQNWYDIFVIQEFIRAFEKVLGRKEREAFLIRLTENKLRGFYGFVIKLLTPAKILANAQNMWSKQFSQGKIGVVQDDADHYTVTISDFETTEPHKNAARIYMREMLRIATGKPVIASYKDIDKDKFVIIFTIISNQKP